MLAYSVAADAIDEYIKIRESTVIESLKRFCPAIVEVFADQYLRSPNTNDIARLLQIGKQRGFSGMLGSLDCSNNDINVLEASHLFANLAQGPARFWEKRVLHDIMTSCIIMHIMIIEDEHDVDAPIVDWVEAPNQRLRWLQMTKLDFKNFLVDIDKSRIKKLTLRFEMR
ncbi:putative harbinger transposase-derived nuclease [Abeliophyllum distichum]|uniref:Harbinger transposase-derived nuclease n=1 Tax=Abeliophyllum distichum TaxID=126358 RepID=A0ABD1QTH0_9LAMI